MRGKEAVLVIFTVEPPIMDPPTRGQPLYKGHYIAIILYYGTDRHYSSAYNSDLNLPERTASQLRTIAPAPKVSFIQRLHCILIDFQVCNR